MTRTKLLQSLNGLKKLRVEQLRTRVIVWLAALAAGLTVATFAVMADTALNAFMILTAPSLYISLVLTPLIGMAVVFLSARYFPGTEGSGIPQVIAAANLAAISQPVNHLLSLRIAIGKILLGCLALVGGFSAGREGPSVQVSASVLNAIHAYIPNKHMIQQRDLILAGGAAGVAAAFNTPLAGIVFAIEELGKRLESKTSAILLIVIIISGLAAQSMLGNYNYFGSLHVSSVDFSIAPIVLLCGAICGILGGLFSWILLLPIKHRAKRIWAFRANRPVVFAGICGLLIALIGILTSGISFGSGYAITAATIAGNTELPWYASASRYGATLISYFSGIPGGIFAPSLATGAAIGANLLSLLGDISQSSIIIALCMAAFLSAVTQAPITSAIIVMEMIDGHQMVISLMTVTLMAKFISSQICPPLYMTLATKWASTSSAQQPETESNANQTK